MARSCHGGRRRETDQVVAAAYHISSTGQKSLPAKEISHGAPCAFDRENDRIARLPIAPNSRLARPWRRVAGEALPRTFIAALAYERVSRFRGYRSSDLGWSPADRGRYVESAVFFS